MVSCQVCRQLSHWRVVTIASETHRHDSWVVTPATRHTITWHKQLG